MKDVITVWWRRLRKTDSPVWHFMGNCPSLKWREGDGLIKVTSNPRSGTKCDHCQRLRKAS